MTSLLGIVKFVEIPEGSVLLSASEGDPNNNCLDKRAYHITLSSNSNNMLANTIVNVNKA